MEIPHKGVSHIFSSIKIITKIIITTRNQLLLGVIHWYLIHYIY